jgi:hypothetical protein
MRESNLLQLKELADRLTIRDTEIKRSICDIYRVLKDDSVGDEQKLEKVKQIIDGCQQEVIKMVGMNTQSS